MLNISKSLKTIFLCFFTVCFSICISFINYPEKNINYFNSDATWHTLLTMNAYSQTPESIHKFVPIVTLGKPGDKHIPWGAAISDKNGNYYYTSFSPASYFLPYAFCNILHIPLTERNLYIFNSFLLILSSVLLAIFIKEIFKNSKHKYLLAYIAIILYVTIPEIMHSMGIVYWAQSLMQVMLLAQILCYCKKDNSKLANTLFYLLSFINPYIEWTGFVANIGFIIAEYFNKLTKKEKIFFTLKILSITMFSGLILCAHFLLNVSFEQFVNTSFQRCSERHGEINDICKLIFGYFQSFKILWLLIFVYIVGIMYKNKNSIFFHNYPLTIILLFPILENFLLLNHAIYYSFDRMKLAFIMIVIICDMFNELLIRYNVKKIILACLSLVIICSFSNVLLYKKDTNYRWEIDYLANNNILADYIIKKYGNTDYAIATNYDVRGYLTLLFNKNIYEYINLDKIPNISGNANFYIYLYQERTIIGIPKITCITIFDKNKKELEKITVEDNKITKEALYDIR